MGSSNEEIPWLIDRLPEECSFFRFEILKLFAVKQNMYTSLLATHLRWTAGGNASAFAAQQPHQGRATHRQLGQSDPTAI